MVAVVYERGLSAYLLALSAAVVFGVANLATPWSFVLVVLGGALCFVPWALAGVAASFAAWAERRTSLASAGPSLLRNLLAMAAQLRLLLGEVALLLQLSLVTAAMFAVIALQYWLLARGVGGSISLSDAWLALGISTLAGIASLIPFGLGVLDGSLAAILDRLGMTLEQGGVVALLVRATVTLPLIVAAFVCYAYLQRSAALGPEATQPSV
jgi:uncharacterized membrane protein YbhN (UPF0104 family)